MPIITASVGSITFNASAGLSQPAQIISAITANVADSSYTFILHDQSVASMNVNEGAGGGVGTTTCTIGTLDVSVVSATTPFFLGEDDAPNSKTLVASSVNIGVGSPVNVQKATQLTIIGNDTGATTSITITNKVTVSSVTG